MLDSRANVQDFEAEHRRFDVYVAALGDERLRGLLIDALGQETDAALRDGVLVRLLEMLDKDGRWQVLESFNVSAFVACRREELDLLDALYEGQVFGLAERGLLLDGTDWLQRRAIRVRRMDVLEVLAMSGRTRRVRSAAAVMQGDIRSDSL